MKADTMSDEAIRPGYKRTEIGVIPDDWEVKRLDQIANVDPENLSASTDPDYAFVYISLEDVDRGTLRSYTEQIFRTAPSRARRVIRKGDVLVSTVRPNLKSHLYIKQEVRDNVCSTGFSVLRCKSCVSDPALIFFHLFAGTIEKQIESLLTGSNYPAINSRDVKALRIPFPPNANEQIAIADVLSDVDALLAALDRLIAKKRAVKQGAMQALLTGRVRLPGFSGNWEVRHLGEVADIKTGERNNEDKVEGGEYPFFVRSQTVERIDTYSFDGEAILVPGEGGIGSIFHYISGKFDYHQRVYKISNFSGNVTGKFIYYTMVYGFHSQATRHSVKATVDSLRLPTFQRYEFASPSASEQRAIAQVLFDMDAEIDALEKRRAKLRDIKQGMMQELLTGRIRLVQPQEQAQEASI